MKKRWKRVAAAAVAFLIVFGLACLHWPRQFQIPETDTFYVSTTFFEVTNGSTDLPSTTYTLHQGQAAYTDLVAVLGRYSYHATVPTILGKNAVEGLSVSILIAPGDSSICITDRGILANDRFYRLGYMSFSKEEQLVAEILAILKDTM